MNWRSTFIFLILTIGLYDNSMGQSGNFESFEQKENEITFISDTGVKLRLQFYSNNVIRFHWIKKGEDFFKNSRYEMVESHKMTGTFKIVDQQDSFLIYNGEGNIGIELQKSPMKYSIYAIGDKIPLLKEKEGVQWQGNTIRTNFVPDEREHFCGMGHQSYGWLESIDLKDKIVNSNYGQGKFNDWSYQGVLTVPFYMSNKGYGIFLNSTFNHSFNFGSNDQYGFEIDTKGFEGQMDYYFIYGPAFKDILDLYTQLTGRPRLPQKSIFGLQLSDKGSPDHSGEEWWKNKITEHRKAGFPFDHIVNDNRWRAGTGAWSGSWFEWDSNRFPDPKAFNKWCEENQVTLTLDFNRNNAQLCEGWLSEYNVPEAEKYVEYPKSTPDYSNPKMRNWIWSVFYKKSFDPMLDFPGDALWIDETDQLGGLNDSIICGNGRSWAENENYYPFLIAKAIVQEGWDNENNNEPLGIGEKKRPFVWVRNMTAGAQRYATHWTGDIPCDYNWMKATIRSLQASGLSGFPYFNHDAGGFRSPGPDDQMYMQWAMAFGSFTPIWRPHGPGENKRWPFDRSEKCREAARTYGKMRYQMMPYIYTYAHRAHSNGIPMAKAMVIDYQNDSNAWKFDLQYMWGDQILVAPNFEDKETFKEVWLPKGQNWYDFWTDKKLNGGQTIKVFVEQGKIPLFVKEGSIIPKYKYALSTFSLDASELILDVYSGHDGDFELYEDDGVSEKFRTKNEKRTTLIDYQEANGILTIHPAIGDYDGAITKRKYKVLFHDAKGLKGCRVNNRSLKIKEVEDFSKVDSVGAYKVKNREALLIVTNEYKVREKVIVKLLR